jgi:hypothetical protein
MKQKPSTRSQKPEYVPLFGTNRIVDPDEPKGIPKISELIKIIVGKDKEWAAIHKHVLVNNMTFFEKCLGVGMLETATGVVHLPEDGPGQWQEIIHFIETGALSIECDAIFKAWLDSGRQDKDLFEQGYQMLAKTLKLYLVAERRGFERLQNYCIDLIRPCLEHTIVHERALLLLLDGTPITDPLRAMVLYDIAEYLKFIGWKKWLKECEQVYEIVFVDNSTYMKERFEATANQGRHPESVWKLTGCQYHSHSNGTKCS